ncbi:MAG: exodeoxyribonuclease VII small subunit [Arhodomonas sp.]|nr:exodeoxyribonuclease VII small subunit [Arhodomonas sp.]
MNHPRRRRRGGAPDFETALAELEQLVARMEGGELSLEESLRAFERGVYLTRICQKALDEAEQKVEILLGGDQEGATLAPFTDGEGGEDGHR